MMMWQIANYGSPFPSLKEGDKGNENAQKSNDLDNIFRVKTDAFEEAGARTFSVNGNKDYPLLLTSMLTGQRALDRGSREMLIWHLKYLLKKLHLDGNTDNAAYGTKGVSARNPTFEN